MTTLKPSRAITIVLLTLLLSEDFAAVAQSGPPALPPAPLAIWPLSGTTWENLWHEAPLGFTNLNSVPSWSDSALSVDTNPPPAFLNLPAFGTNTTNIVLYNGSLAFWGQMNWSSATDGGTGPGDWAPLFQVGRFSTNDLYGCWSLVVSPDGNTLAFVTQTNGAGEIHFQTSIDWDAGDWHYVVITYCATNCALFLEGNLVTNTPPIAYWPSYAECVSNGLWIGSDPSGILQAHAQFQDLETYDVPLSADLIQWNYTLGSSAILDWGGTVPVVWGGGHFGDDVPALPGGGSPGDGPTPSYTSPTYSTNLDTDYSAYTNFWLTIATSSSGTQCIVSVQNTLSNLTYDILTNSCLDTNLSDWGVWAAALASNSVIVAPPYNITSNSLFWQAKLVWSTTTNDLPDWWEMEYFGNLHQPANGDYDGDGVNNGQEYTNGTDPNKIRFTISITNQYVNLTNVPLTLAIQGGVPSYGALLLDTNNFTNATWTAYTSSNLTAHLGTNQGWHTVWVGLRGLPANAQQTWTAVCLYLDLTPPTLVITNPTGGAVTQPMIQLQGYANEELASLRFDLTNALGTISNQTGFITGCAYNTNTFAYTTNFFKCYDLPLTNGVNTITLHATDRAGNVTTVTTNFTLSYASKTNPPVVQLYWPQTGAHLAGSSFTVRGSLDDFTDTVSARITDTNGDTNVVAGVVERNGNFWVDNVPLAAGTNVLTLTATDAAGNVTTTNLNLVQSGVIVTINPVSLSLNQPTATVTGTISASNYTVWVNGVKATQSNMVPPISWSASNVPMNGAGSAAIQARAIPDSDNSGNGTSAGRGGTNSSLNNPGNPAAADAQDTEINLAKPAGIYCSYFHYSYWEEVYGNYDPSDPSADITETFLTTETDDWSARAGGWQQITTCDTSTGYGAPSYWYTFGQGQWDTNGNATGEYGDSEECGVVTNVAPTAPGYAPALFEGMEGQNKGYWSSSADGIINGSDTVTHAATTRYNLQTGGGRSLPGQNNLFAIYGGARISADPWFPESATNNIFGWTVYTSFINAAAVDVLGQQESPDAAVYVALPAGETLDVTPTSGSSSYYLVGPGYDEYQPQIYFGGTNVTGSNITVIVGQQIGLTFTLGGSAPAMSNFSWTIPDTTESQFFVSADSAHTNGYPIPLTGTNTNSLSFFWVDASTKKVTCSAEIGGATGTASTTFTVLRPTVSVATMTGTVTIGSSSFGYLGIQFGNANSATNLGIYFTNTITVPTNFSGYSNGFRAQWVQLITLASDRITISNTVVSNYYLQPVGTVLDTVYPYPDEDIWGTTADSPGVDLSFDSEIDASKVMEAEMWLMYVPDAPGIGNWVPLWKVKWSCDAEAAGFGSAPAGWSFTGTPSLTVLTSEDSGSTYPLWTNNITKVPWSPPLPPH